MAPKAHTVEPSYENQDALLLPFYSGEELAYEVLYKELKIGTSTMTFHGEEEIGDKKAYHITFFTRVTAFTDQEELYADIETFLPVKVHRTLKRFGTFTTRIEEIYDQEKFRVDIRKKSKLRKEEFFIEKDSPIHNAILLSYYYRANDAYKIGKKYKINLPTLEFDVMYTGKETIETPMGEFDAFAFTSSPERFKLWLSTDKRRIPLKIENPASKLDYSFVMKSLIYKEIK